MRFILPKFHASVILVKLDYLHKELQVGMFIATQNHIAIFRGKNIAISSPTIFLLIPKLPNSAPLKSYTSAEMGEIYTEFISDTFLIHFNTFIVHFRPF